MLGPMLGVDCRSRSKSSINLLASWVVLRVVFRVFTGNLMKPLDWWKRQFGQCVVAARTRQIPQMQWEGCYLCR